MKGVILIPVDYDGELTVYCERCGKEIYVPEGDFLCSFCSKLDDDNECDVYDDLDCL